MDYAKEVHVHDFVEVGGVCPGAFETDSGVEN